MGGNLITCLLPDLREYQFTMLDFDLVTERNLNVQPYFPEQIGELKSESLQYNLYKMFLKEVDIISEKLTASNLVNILNNYDLIVDCFDNHQARNIVQSFWKNYGIRDVIHIGLSDQMTFEISWAESYSVPTDITSGIDICELEGVSSFIKQTSALASQVIQCYLKTGEKREFVGNKFSMTEIR